MSDRTDNLIEALVRARESGMTRSECVALIADVFDAPWSDAIGRKAAAQRESLAMLAMSFFEFSPTVTIILIAMRTGVAPEPEDIVQVCKVIREGRRRFHKIMPKCRDFYEVSPKHDVSAKHDFEEA